MNKYSSETKDMRKSFSLFAFLFLILAISAVDAMPPEQKPRVIVMTDIGGDTDDEQSMVRFLLYSDMLDVKGHLHYQQVGARTGYKT
jgi:hypothetical protein